jgi:hypothetical protein
MSAVMDLVRVYRRMLRSALHEGADPESIVKSVNAAEAAFTGSVKALVEEYRNGLLSAEGYSKCLEKMVGIFRRRIITHNFFDFTTFLYKI